MPSLAIDLQRRRHSMPGWRDCGRFLCTPDQLQFADLVDVGCLESRICHTNAHSLNSVADSELVGIVSSRTNCDSKIAALSACCSFHPQYVAQIGMASLIERTG